MEYLELNLGKTTLEYLARATSFKVGGLDLRVDLSRMDRLGRMNRAQSTRGGFASGLDFGGFELEYQRVPGVAFAVVGYSKGRDINPYYDMSLYGVDSDKSHWAKRSNPTCHQRDILYLSFSNPALKVLVTTSKSYLNY
eukprot:scaffold23479_cov143-Cylindrotheca_fusiformis.AAC.21